MASILRFNLASPIFQHHQHPKFTCLLSIFTLYLFLPFTGGNYLLLKIYANVLFLLNGIQILKDDFASELL